MFRSGRLACYQQAGVGGSGREGVGQAAETESTLALAENVYVNLPRPYFEYVLANHENIIFLQFKSTLQLANMSNFWESYYFYESPKSL